MNNHLPVPNKNRNYCSHGKKKNTFVNLLTKILLLSLLLHVCPFGARVVNYRFRLLVSQESERGRGKKTKKTRLPEEFSKIRTGSNAAASNGGTEDGAGGRLGL